MTKYASLARIALLLLAVGAGGVAVARPGNQRGVQEAQATPRAEGPRTIGPAAFPHQSHFEDLEIECKTCHHETNATELRMPHQDYFDDFWIDCRICHNNSGAAGGAPKSCSTCHHRSPTGIADETLSAKVVIHKKCWECHDSGTGDAASKGCAKCHAKIPDPDAAPDSSGASPKEG